MSPCPLEEIQAMLAPVRIPVAIFSFTVFGGSARMARLLNTKATVIDTDLCTVVEATLRQHLCGSEYADKNILILQAARVITERISDMQHQHQTQSDTDASQFAAVKYSLFKHRYFEVSADGNGGTRIVYASTFMRLLDATLAKRREELIRSEAAGGVIGSSMV
jgi:hypothetical protein